MSVLDSTAALAQLDAHTVETVAWHFHESTGCPFWLEKEAELKFDPLKEVQVATTTCKKFPPFEDEWLRGGPVRRWVPKALADKPVYVFETGGTTGMPKSRIAIDDFRTDYSLFSDTLPDKYFPKGANWLMLGPQRPAAAAAGGRAPGPASRRHLLLHRSRSAVGHQAHQEGLDGAPRSVQAALHRPGDHDSRRRARREVHVRHAEAARSAVPGAWKNAARSLARDGHHRHLLRRHRVHAAVDAVLRRGIVRRPARRERHLHDAHLRQHADGPGLQRSR